jgi:hypothetical protein
LQILTNMNHLKKQCRLLSCNSRLTWIMKKNTTGWDNFFPVVTPYATNVLNTNVWQIAGALENNYTVATAELNGLQRTITHRFLLKRRFGVHGHRLSCIFYKSKISFLIFKEFGQKYSEVANYYPTNVQNIMFKILCILRNVHSDLHVCYFCVPHITKNFVIKHCKIVGYIIDYIKTYFHKKFKHKKIIL